MKLKLKELEKQISIYTSVFYRIIAFSITVGFILRIILLFNRQTEIAFSFADWIKIFLLGAVNDIFAAIISCFFIWLIFIFFSENKYKKPWGYIIWGLIGTSLIYTSVFNTIFDDYGSVVPKIVRYFLLFKLISFSNRLFVPSIRNKWRIGQYYLTFFIYITCILFNAISEYFFWNEFGVRYNFIAVDYLIYTNEVIGNIFESYPIIPLLVVLFIVSVLTTYLLTRNLKLSFEPLPSFHVKIGVTLVYFTLVTISCFLLHFNTKFQNTKNVYVNELQSNGGYKFYNAFISNELNYQQFYTTLPENEVWNIIHKEYNSTKNNCQLIKDSLPEVHKNIILITVESMSASFMKHYGNEENITPYLDKLLDEGIAFNKMFATGNRTVRGLEALTLSLPPCPGQSIVKRPNNSNLFSTGKILKEKGYTVQYFYGGDSYFDNMCTFFSGNRYQIIDKKTFGKDDITFHNIWGVCDENMFAKALSVFNENAKSGKPFFGHILTVSNHRPFTYPDGKIDIPADSKSRNGGVKYTDYALGQFIEAAKKEDWFENTIFVIVADHCASSAGKVEIPLKKYHIPGLIYAPGYIKPQQINFTTSQIDIIPTLFGLLHFSYESYFYGKNVFSANYKPRALIATYQDLGYLESHVLTILSPVRKVQQYEVSENDSFKFELKRKDNPDFSFVKQAVAYYQTTDKKKLKIIEAILMNSL